MDGRIGGEAAKIPTAAATHVDVVAGAVTVASGHDPLRNAACNMACNCNTWMQWVRWSSGDGEQCDPTQRDNAA